VDNHDDYIITILAKLRAEAAKLQVCTYISFNNDRTWWLVSFYHIYLSYPTYLLFNHVYLSSIYCLILSNIFVLYKAFQQQIIDCGLEEVFKSFDTDNDG